VTAPGQHRPRRLDQPRPDDPWLTVPEIASALRVGKSSVYRLVASGDLRAARIGRQLRIRKSDVTAYLNRSKVV
jgi:excisionase family DNA binding protein